MATKLASEDPPMTLARRDELQQHQISFHVPPHDIIFNTNAGDLMSEKQLREFVDGTLSKLAREFPSIEVPKPGAWKLSTKDIDEDLRKWEPHKLVSGALVVIETNLKNHQPVITGTVATGDRSWSWARTLKTFELPIQDVFVLDVDSHVLLILSCQTKVKIVGKAKKNTKTTTHGILVPKSHTVSNVLETIRASPISGVYQVPHEDNLRNDQRTATELGWTNGTILRLELW